MKKIMCLIVLSMSLNLFAINTNPINISCTLDFNFLGKISENLSFAITYRQPTYEFELNQDNNFGFGFMEQTDLFNMIVFAEYDSTSFKPKIDHLVITVFDKEEKVVLQHVSTVSTALNQAVRLYLYIPDEVQKDFIYKKEYFNWDILTASDQEFYHQVFEVINENSGIVSDDIPEEMVVKKTGFVAECWATRL